MARVATDGNPANEPGQVLRAVPDGTLEQTELDTLAEQFKARLEVLQQPQSHDRLARVLASRGRARKAPKAGKDF